jgi:hypothetical protein
MWLTASIKAAILDPLTQPVGESGVIFNIYWFQEISILLVQKSQNHPDISV